jgi:hypothetical protein
MLWAIQSSGSMIDGSSSPAPLFLMPEPRAQRCYGAELAQLSQCDREDLGCQFNLWISAAFLFGLTSAAFQFTLARFPDQIETCFTVRQRGVHSVRKLLRPTLAI